MIKSENYITDEIRQAAEKEALASLMSLFSEKMFEKIIAKMEMGYSGWDKNVPPVIEMLKSKLADNINSGDWVDVANISMMLWNMTQPNDQTKTGTEAPVDVVK